MHLHFRVLGVGRLWRWLQGRQGWGTWARWSDLKRGLQTRRSQCMLGYTTRTWPCSKARQQLPFPQEIEDTKERLWHEIGGCNTNVYFILGVVDVFAWAYVCKWLWEQREQDASEFLLRRWSCWTWAGEFESNTHGWDLPPIPDLPVFFPLFFFLTCHLNYSLEIDTHYHPKYFNRSKLTYLLVLGIFSIFIPIEDDFSVKFTIWLQKNVWSINQSYALFINHVFIDWSI